VQPASPRPPPRVAGDMRGILTESLASDGEPGKGDALPRLPGPLGQLTMSPSGPTSTYRGQVTSGCNAAFYSCMHVRLHWFAVAANSPPSKLPGKVFKISLSASNGYNRWPDRRCGKATGEAAADLGESTPWSF
jgi:hypothetical protein